MALKGWVLNKVNRLFTRVDLPPRATPLGQAVMRRAGEQRAASPRAAGGHDTLRPQHLGAYAPLVAAMREELEHFVASHVRMHLAIAEHDRYLLTSIEVDCVAGHDSRELLQRFMREFKPEQIKHYLAKEVIGRLPNASAIDLAHFGGLNAAPGSGDAAEADEAYGELLAELRRTEPRAGQRPYQVSLKGRWSELDTTRASAKDKARGFDVPVTPLAGRALEAEIDDANGNRHVTLPSVLPGRRYAVGHGEGCDIVVNGQYTSRRHCEIWFDKGSWWVTDSGSTNGIRVESANSVLGRSAASAGPSGGGPSVIEVVAGARIVLSAFARGEPSQYPRLLLRTSELGTPATPLAPRAQAPTTPSTPIVARRGRDSAMMLTVRMASGERQVELPAEPLPFRVGRSRSQSLVIDWAHEDVSGHHVDIVEIDEGSAQVVVHGDNGVMVAGASHAPGTRFRWNLGDTMVLGRALGKEAECTLTLSRRE
jgi:hypothetical protein